jgi:rSAM/selenodomain-associated transferase 2
VALAAQPVSHEATVTTQPLLSIIIPTLNEADTIGTALSGLQAMRNRGVELIVVDGSSSDTTLASALKYADQAISAPLGRATQMNAGAGIARGNILLFLHADSTLPDGADTLVVSGLERSARLWGRFDVRLSGTRWSLRLVAAMMNWRSRLIGIATGDQGMFMRRSTFEAVDGFPAIALMEDIALSRRLLRFGRPLCLSERILTSSRRWEKGGVLRTILLMWTLRLAFFCGVDPARLARIYHGR